MLLNLFTHTTYLDNNEPDSRYAKSVNDGVLTLQHLHSCCRRYRPLHAPSRYQRYICSRLQQPKQTANFVHVVVTFFASTSTGSGRMNVYIDGVHKGQELTQGNFVNRLTIRICACNMASMSHTIKNIEITNTLS